MKKSFSNDAASVRQSLLNRARRTGEDYYFLLTRFAIQVSLEAEISVYVQVQRYVYVIE